MSRTRSCDCRKLLGVGPVREGEQRAAVRHRHGHTLRDLELEQELVLVDEQDAGVDVARAACRGERRPRQPLAEIPDGVPSDAAVLPSGAARNERGPAFQEQRSVHSDLVHGHRHRGRPHHRRAAVPHPLRRHVLRQLDRQADAAARGLRVDRGLLADRDHAGAARDDAVAQAGRFDLTLEGADLGRFAAGGGEVHLQVLDPLAAEEGAGGDRGRGRARRRGRGGGVGCGVRRDG